VWGFKEQQTEHFISSLHKQQLKSAQATIIQIGYPFSNTSNSNPFQVQTAIQVPIQIFISTSKFSLQQQIQSATAISVCNSNTAIQVCTFSLQFQSAISDIHFNEQQQYKSATTIQVCNSNT
jgi:hypothetical protein